MEVVNRIEGKDSIIPRSPLYSFIVQGVGRLTGAQHQSLVREVVRGIPIVCGVISALLLYQLWLVRYRGMGTVLFGIFLGGYIGLFQGYIECYAMVVTAIFGYVAVLLASPGKGRSIVLLLMQALSVLAHTLGVLLLPVTIWAVLETSSRRKRTIGVIAALTLLISLTLARFTGLAGGLLLSWVPPWHFFSRQLGYLFTPPSWSPGLFSFSHLIDIANGYFLSLAAGSILGLALFLTGKGRNALWGTLRSPLGAVAILFFAARCLIITPLGGPVLDWDLFAVFAIPWAFFLAETWRRGNLKEACPPAGRVLMTASVLFLIPMVAMLASSSASTRRVLGYRSGTPNPPPYVQAQIAHHLGDQAGRNGDSEQASHLFSQAFSLDANPVYARRAGAAWMRVGNEEQALQQFSNAIALDSLDIVSLEQRGFLWLGRHDPLHAENDFRSVQRIAPSQVRSLLGLGFVARMQGDREGERKRMEEVVYQIDLKLKQGSGTSLLYLDLGSALFELGRFEEARIALEKAAVLGRDRQGVWSTLGDCYVKLSRYADARRAYEKAHELAPRWSEPLRSLGRVCELEGDRDGALDAYSRALTIRPDSRLYLLRGKLYLNMGKRNEAHQDAQCALALNAHDAEAAQLLSLSSEISRPP